jgi:dolichyl-phosphate beta-glucosyltransferase
VSSAAQPGETIGFWDADLATPLDAIAECLDVFDSQPRVQLVMGARVQLLGRSIQRTPLRHYLGRCFAAAASLVLGIPVYDTQCGAKLFRATPPMLAAFAEPFSSRWIFDVEILARLGGLYRNTAAFSGELPIWELPLRQWHDIAGSKLRARHFLLAVGDLARIALRYRVRGYVPPECPRADLAPAASDKPRSTTKAA